MPRRLNKKQQKAKKKKQKQQNKMKRRQRKQNRKKRCIKKEQGGKIEPMQTATAQNDEPIDENDNDASSGNFEMINGEIHVPYEEYINFDEWSESDVEPYKIWEKERDEIVKKEIEQQVRERFEDNTPSNRSKLRPLNDSNVHSIWRLFPYQYRINSSRSEHNFNEAEHFNLYVLGEGFFEAIASLRGFEEYDPWTILDGLTVKEFQIMIEQNLPNAMDECSDLKKMFDNAQFGDVAFVDPCGDIDAIGIGSYVLGFGDLPMSDIQNAYNTNTERDYLKFIKPFEFDSDNRSCLPMEVGDAPNNYYQCGPLCEASRIIDPSRAWHEGVVFRKSFITWMSFDVEEKWQKSDYLFILYDDEKDRDRVFVEKSDMRAHYQDVVEMSGMESYITRYDDAIRLRYERVKECLIQSLYPMFNSDTVTPLLSYLLSASQDESEFNAFDRLNRKVNIQN